MSGRITSNILTTNYLRNMKRNLGNMKTLQNQLASGKEIQRASENPYKASRSMQLNIDMSYNKQYNENIKDTTNWLDTTDTALSQIGNIFGRVETLLVSAGNGTYGQDERTSIQDEIKEKVNELSQVLNTSFDGSYIFGGTKTDSKPVMVVAGVLQYSAKDGNSITAYKKDDGTITSEATITNMSYTLDALGKTTLATEKVDLSNSSPDAARIVEINDLLGGAVPTYKTQNGTITSSATTTNSLYTLDVVGIATLQTEKSKLSSSTDATRIAEIDAVLGGSPAYKTQNGTITSSATTDNTLYTLESAGKAVLNTEKIKLSSSTDTTKIATRITEINGLIASPIGSSEYKKEDGTITSAATTDNKEVSLNITDIKALQSELSPIAGSGSSRETEINGLLTKAIPITQINSYLQVDISEGVNTTYNKTAVDVLEFKDKSGKSINVSDLLATIIKNLGATGNTSDLTTTNLTDIQSVTANLLQQRSQVGSFQNRMDSAQTNNDTQNYNLTDILSKTEDIDFADKTMEYSMMQTVYTAALQTSAKILPMTILTYL